MFAYPVTLQHYVDSFGNAEVQLARAVVQAVQV